MKIFGLDPPMEALMLHGLYRKHLVTVFEFQFPEHYGEVLMHLLNVSIGGPEQNMIALSVWLDILNSLTKPVTLNLKASLRYVILFSHRFFINFIRRSHKKVLAAQ